MRHAIRDKWVQGLESGLYMQGIGWLNYKGQFCCLGVLTDLYLKEQGMNWEYDSRGVGLFRGKIELALPDEVANWAGLEHPNPLLGDRCINEHNDYCGRSFGELSYLIMKYL